MSAAGNLDVTLAPGYLPSLGQTFDLLDFATFAGGFQLDLPDLGPGLGWDSTALGTTGVLQVVAILNSLPGDYNHDGIVDASDYTVWRDTLGQTGAGLAADGSGPTPGTPDGVVDQLDYDFWRANFGNTSGAGSAAAVPEPATLTQVLVLFALAVGLRLKWRAGRQSLFEYDDPT